MKDSRSDRWKMYRRDTREKAKETPKKYKFRRTDWQSVTRTHNITIKRTKEDLAAEHDGNDAKLNSQCSFRCDVRCDAMQYDRTQQYMCSHIQKQ